MPSFKIIGLPVLEKKILKVFAIYSHGSHLGHVTWTIYTNFRSPFIKMLHMKFDFDWLSEEKAVSEEMIFEIVKADGRTMDGRRSMIIL